MEKPRSTGLPARKPIVARDQQPASRWAAFSAWRRGCIAAGEGAAGSVAEDQPVMVGLTDSGVVIDLRAQPSEGDDDGEQSGPKGRNAVPPIGPNATMPPRRSGAL
jgi:hypothetical protein